MVRQAQHSSSSQQRQQAGRQAGRQAAEGDEKGGPGLRLGFFRGGLFPPSRMDGLDCGLDDWMTACCARWPLGTLTRPSWSLSLLGMIRGG